MSGITMQGPFDLYELSPRNDLRCCAELQGYKRIQCPNTPKHYIKHEGEEYNFCGIHLKPNFDSVIRMNNPKKFATSVVPSVLDLTLMESLLFVNKQIKEELQLHQQEIQTLKQLLYALQQFMEKQQEQIELLKFNDLQKKQTDDD